ncbi:NAD-dependent epimerase/dehydratase family protein [Azohydromonas australica]|uniref:NAD-dependent epimerase/dehydratase family protein n=1 Tax=Azohydromonas australica TaxID=364039 RepID=UPI000403CD57|nr:NAD(P)-dependent oxidoreductase [Azohydromonas australica]
MKVFVIGGAGFIGRRVVRLLAAEGHEVVSLDIATADFSDLGCQVQSQHLDLTSFEDVIAAMATHKPQAVINLSYMRENLPRPAMKVNVLGMDNCFEAARLADVAHVVYSSSIAVNGSQAPYGKRPILETDPPCPAKQYSVHKVFNEWQAKEYREKHGMRITGLRAAHIAGTDKLIGSVDHVQCIVNSALERKSLFDYRDRMRCIVYADDIAEVFVRLALKPKPEHTLYNSGGETLSLGQLAGIVRKFLPEADIAFEHDTGGEAVSGGYLFDNQRLMSEFGIQYPPYEQRVGQMIASLRRGK